MKGDKSPMLESGHNYLYQLIDEQDIDRLFMRAQKVGIACGKVSNGFYCMDFDCHGGEDIRTVFNKFARNDTVKTIIDKYHLPIFKTPSGGYHLYFKLEDVTYKGHCISKWANGTVMIEIRGHGQYVCTFPSDDYLQLAGSEIIKVATITTDEKEALFSIAESFNLYISKPEQNNKGNGIWPDKFDTSKPIGRYNETEVEHAKELLVDAGWRYVKTRRHDGVELWLRPNKVVGNGTPSHSATFGKYHNMFYVYTESDTKFEPWKAYSLFDILLRLKFGGDFSSAMSWLEDRYRRKIETPDPPEFEPTQPDDEQQRKKVDFPIDIFPNHVSEFITQLNNSLNYSVDFLSLSVMFTMSVLNGNKYKLKVKNGWVAPSIFWFAIVGEPGTMKSHPVGLMISPLKELDKRSKKSYDSQLAEYETMESKGRKPRFKQLLVGDYTLEALHNVHENNKRGIGLYKDELVGFLNDMNKYRKGSDEQFWLESFNNKSYIVNRATKEPVIIEDTNINIIGTIQPSVLNKVVKDFDGNGLVDRFLYTTAETEIYPLPRRDIDQRWIDWYLQSMIECNSFFEYNDSNDSYVLTLSEDALGVFYDADERLIAMQKSDDLTPNMKGYINKMKTYLPRFALIMGLFDMCFNGYTTEINEEHMAKAVRLMDYFIQSASVVFAEAETKQEISQIVASMFGKTKKEKIILLHNKGFKNYEICKELNTSKEVVSRVIKLTKSQL